MSTMHNLTGEVLTRFISVSTLLYLIDPIRGEATDKHPHDGAWKLDNLQKKFLDSFALISSTSRKGGESASAVCLEQGHPSGNVLRLARNLGVPGGLVARLQSILDRLYSVALVGHADQKTETGILLEIINLNRDKIWSLLEKLNRESVREEINRAISRMTQDDSFVEDAEETNFKHWVGNLPALASLENSANASVLPPHIKWASQARWVYSEQLELLLSSATGDLPRWISQIYKLGRYFAATKAMLKFASKRPDLFSSIHVEIVEAPQPEIFSLTDQEALVTTLRRVTKSDGMELMAELGQAWLTEQPENRFRHACRHKLVVHAEMQLLNFYDHHPALTPRLLFMGTSKKACFLCHEFLSRHPLKMSVSACHQKIYPSWMPAPCASAVRKQNKVLLWELSRHLEATAARDLETRLGVRRRPTWDSTAGPSLTTTSNIASWQERLVASVKPQIGSNE